MSPLNPAARFAVPADHPDREAHEWLDAFLGSLDWDPAAPPWQWERRVHDLIPARLEGLAPRFQVALLKACLERMPWHRGQPSSDETGWAHYKAGAALYGIACTLYRRKLPYSGRDVCDVLNLSRHGCGHGCDVSPPFDLALAHARKHGVSAELLAAVRGFLDGLKGVGSTQAARLKRKGGLLLVLDAEAGAKTKPCWSDRFRAGLPALPPEEQARWRGLVLTMTANDLYAVPKAWRPEATKFLEALGPARVVERLAAWWPDPRAKAVWPLQTGGSHLLKHFIWLLDLIPPASDAKAKGTGLVVRLAEVDWKPRERAQKVVIAAAAYLAGHPPAVSWPALQRLAAWSAAMPDGARGGKIPELLQDYRVRHGLEL